MDAPIDEPRAKDLLRQKAIEPRDAVGHWLVGTLFKRAWRRPAGSSAKLFKAMSTEDPFAPPADFVDPGPRALYVADRFVRIDKARKVDPGQKLAAKGKVPAWVEQMQARREEEARKAAEGKKQKAPPKRGQKPAPPAKGPQMQHTPAFGAAAAPPVDRTPPRVENPTPQARPKVQRVPIQAPARPPPAEAQKGGAPIDRTPPRVAPTPQGRIAPAKPQGKPLPPRRPVDPNIDRTPPMVAHVPTDSRGEPLRTNQEIRKAKAAGGALGGAGETPWNAPKPVQQKPPPVPPKPPVAQPKPPVAQPKPPGAQPNAATPQPAQPKSATPQPSSSGGMDDLFGGPMEGRAKIGARPKKTVEAVPDEPKPAPASAVDRTPPLIDRTPPLFRDAPPPKSEPEPAEAPKPAPKPAAAKPAPTPAPPPAAKPPPAPPKPPAAPTGGLDDLFGAPSEGRPKMAPRLKKTVVAVPDEPAPEPAKGPDIDRAPPLIQNVDPSKLPK